MIVLDTVSKRFGDRTVLSPTSLTVASGHALALVGPSGSGKSTLLRMIVGLVIPDTGHIVVDGTALTRASLLDVRRRTGYVIQSGGLFPHLTARGNVTLLARHLGWPDARVAPRVSELASMVRIDEALLDRHPGELSGGEQQRIAIMRALMLDPPVLLLDEPMAALDPVARARLREDLKRIFRAVAKTVVVVTHDLDEAARLGDDVAIMRAGRVVQRGTIDDLVAAPSEPFVREFIEARSSCA